MNTTNKEIDQLAKNYIDNFYYTSNHVSIYKSDNFTLALYKNTETITNLSLPVPKINIEANSRDIFVLILLFLD